MEADLYTLELVEQDEIETVWEPLEREFWSGKELFHGGGHDIEEFIEERFHALAKSRKEKQQKGDVGGRFSDAIAEILEKYDINKLKPETA